MCGINGIINKSQKSLKREQIHKMNEVLRYRGPDDSGTCVHGNIGLGHTRLSILDLSQRAQQPMEFDNCIVTYNGEVFNFLELREKLKKSGILFESDSDTEVILKAYIHYGISFVNKLNGMFALSIYDKQKNKIYLVRDRYGIKPLYLYRDSEKIIFSSEIKAILEDEVSVSIDKNSVVEYFQFHYIKDPNSIFNEIKRVKAGYVYDIDLDTFDIGESCYYTLQDKKEIISDKNKVLQTMDTYLHDSISKRMISDVEVGTFLSGGVDSSLITAIASQYTDRTLQTFSISFKGVSSFFDESEYAAKVSKKYHTDHHFLELDFDKMFDEFDEIVYALDEPIADTSVFLNYYLSKLTKEHVTVALSGVGGDELFGGYNRHQAFMISKYLAPFKFLKHFSAIENLGSSRSGKVGNTIRHLSKLLASLGNNANETYLNMVSYQLLKEYDLKISDYQLQQVLNYDIREYLNANLLNFTDRMSMASSLEIRTPFLDYRLVDFSMSIDDRLKCTIGQKKIILKELALQYLDKDIVYRRKQGFSAPIEIWLKKKGLEYIRSMIDDDLIGTYINKEIVYKDLELFFHNGVDRSMQIYSYLVFSRWYKNFGRFIHE